MHDEARKEAQRIEEMKVEERMRHVYRMAKVKALCKRDVVGCPCMRCEDGKLRMQLKDMLKLWKDYCENLLNEENLWDNTLEVEKNVGPVKVITVEEVRNAMGKLKKGKAAGPSGVPIDAIRLCNVEGTLAKIGNGMMNGEGMPTSWRKSVLIPLYKGKGDAKECTSYRSLKMLEHAMKVLERVFEERLCEKVKINEMQMDFLPRKGTIDAIFAVRQLIEKNGKIGKELYFVFVDLEKFVCVFGEVIWWALRKKGVMEHEVRAVMEMYKEVETSVKLE